MKLGDKVTEKLTAAEAKELTGKAQLPTARGYRDRRRAAEAKELTGKAQKQAMPQYSFEEVWPEIEQHIKAAIDNGEYEVFIARRFMNDEIAIQVRRLGYRCGNLHSSLGYLVSWY